MTDRVLLSAGRNNFEACVELACQYNLGIEVMAFAFPDVLDGNWPELVAAYQALLRPVPGELAIHGPFLDMVSGSPDKKINEVSAGRYRHAIQIAAELGAKIAVFHANFIGALHNPEYRVGWHERNVVFWRPLAEFAAQHDVIICIENMWEFEPNIIGNLLRDVDHPNLQACLDVGHAHLFSDPSVSFEEWLNVMEPWLLHTHMNNNDGRLDVHHALNDGLLNYHRLLTQIRALAKPPSITLEMYTVEAMRASLPYLQISESRPTLA